MCVSRSTIRSKAPATSASAEQVLPYDVDWRPRNTALGRLDLLEMVAA